VAAHRSPPAMQRNWSKMRKIDGYWGARRIKKLR
jgi:hypothetical protein